MEMEIQTIISGNPKDVRNALEKFLDNNAQIFTFKDLNKNGLRNNLWNALFNYLNTDEMFDLHVSSLAAIRILSRDKTNLDQLINENRLEILLKHAKLETNESISDNLNYTILVEALKCLCNIVYNSIIAASLCTKNNCLNGIMNRTKFYRSLQLPMDIKIFDMKVLFLITALCSEVRPKLKEELHGLTYLIEILEFMTAKQDRDNQAHNSDFNGMIIEKYLTNIEIDLICEILKVLFNLTIRSNEIQVDEEEKAHYMQLASVLQKLLNTQVKNPTKQLELHNHVINLLTNMPNECFKQLIIPIQEHEIISKDLQYEEQNMKTIYQLYMFLENRLSDELTLKSQQEQLSPILTVLLKGVNGSRFIRKYLRIKILPPLRDVYNRPEQGNTVRNCLCRLLTTPITNVRDLTADLLFVLCKENVGRMIKYTGYGNAAGLFAKRGLLGGNQINDCHYSSDSEDSDTEEYREYKHGINPVIGCYEPPHPSPTANMTEEQKEYEAMKLVNLMDNLTRKGVVQPCRIGEDGRPQPIEHVLELQESLPNQQISRDSEDD